MNEKSIKEVIVVEGKTDTQKLQSIYGPDIKTIETKGLAFNKNSLELIKKINDEQGIIIFTDPDGPGKKIREAIVQYLNGNVKNAFITKNDIDKKSKKIGIAEADDEAIKNALSSLIQFDIDAHSLKWADYLNNNFYLKKNRVVLAKHFGFDQNVSSKTLFKWLNWMNLNTNQIKQILKDVE